MTPPVLDDTVWPGAVADYRRALSTGGRQHHGHFAIEGFRLLERALSSSTPLARVLVGERDFAHPGPRLAALLKRLQEAEIRVTLLPEAVLDELVEGRTFGPVLALAAVPEPLDLEQTLRAWGQSPTRRKILILEEIMDPGNVGALLRTAHALGVEAVVAVGGSDPFHPRATRTSMGSVFRMPILRWDSADSLLALLRAHRVLTVGAATEASDLRPQIQFPNRTIALFVGNEGKGISASLRAQLDQLVAIPMGASIDSFSVNAATAVILYAMTYAHAHPLETQSQ